MKKEGRQLGIELTDQELDAYYPLKIQKLSATHWTPVAIARKAIRFLVRGPETKVLDVGSGVGKFCLVAASCSEGHMSGVENRESLVRLSRKMASKLALEIDFIHANVKSLDFKVFDAFYFFNSFGENIDLTDRLDRENSIDEAAYLANCRFLQHQFENSPIGTRIVTYCGGTEVIPSNYALIKTDAKGKLKCWEKRF